MSANSDKFLRIRNKSIHSELALWIAFCDGEEYRKASELFNRHFGFCIVMGEVSRKWSQNQESSSGVKVLLDFMEIG